MAIAVYPEHSRVLMGGISVDQEVRWLLTEKLFLVRTSRVNPQEDAAGRRLMALATFDSTLEALRYVNAISEDESNHWRDKMWRAVGLDPPGTAESGKVQLVYLGDGEPPQREPISLVPQYPRTVARRGETLSAFDGRMQIQEVEYDDSVTVVRWQIDPLPDVDAAFPELAAALEEDLAGMDDWAIGHFRFKNREALQQHRMRQLALEDSVGTEYSEHPVSAKSGGVGGIKGITAFTPGTPSHAERLIVHWLGSSITLPL
jgi:hypothetical protein